MPSPSATLSPAERELERLRQQELELLAKQKEMAQLPLILEREKKERETTMPPMPEILERKRVRRHEEEIATRGAVRNLQKAQNRSLLLIFMLIAATAALVAWGLRLMEG